MIWGKWRKNPGGFTGVSLNHRRHGGTTVKMATPCCARILHTRLKIQHRENF